MTRSPRVPLYPHSILPVPNLLSLPTGTLPFASLGGALLFQLKSFQSNAHGVHLVAGSYHIADGDSSTANDLRGTLQGVYIESTGLLAFGTTGSMTGLKIRWEQAPNASSSSNTSAPLREERVLWPTMRPGGKAAAEKAKVEEEKETWGGAMSAAFASLHTSLALLLPHAAPEARQTWTNSFETVDASHCVIWAEFQVAPVAREGQTSPFRRRLDAPDLQPGEGLLEIVENSEVNVNYRKRNPRVIPPVVLPMVGVAMSDNCHFGMNITATALVVDKVLVEEKAMQYSMMVSCPACLHPHLSRAHTHTLTLKETRTNTRSGTPPPCSHTHTHCYGSCQRIVAHAHLSVNSVLLTYRSGAFGDCVCVCADDAVHRDADGVSD